MRKNQELPSFTVDIHRHTHPDQVTFTRMQPARSPQWNIYPFGEQPGWNYSRFTEIFGLAHAEEVERRSLERKGFVRLSLPEVPRALKRYIVYGVCPPEWNRQLAAGDPDYVDRVAVWIKGTVPEPDLPVSP